MRRSGMAAAAAAALVIASAAQAWEAILPCLDRKGLCRYDDEGGSSLRFKPARGVGVAGFAQLPDGLLAVLLSTHTQVTDLLVVDSRGRVVARREDPAQHIDAAIGLLADGRPVTCGRLTDPTCSFLSGESAAVSGDVPPTCTAPHTDDAGRLWCVRAAPTELAAWTRGGDGAWSVDRSEPLRGLHGWGVCGSSPWLARDLKFELRAPDLKTLLMFDAESVDWARQVAGAVWLGSSHRAPGSEDVVHSLWRVSCGGDATLIGRSAETIPFDLAVPSPGRILVYRENRSGTRSIEILDLLAKGDTFESLVAASPEPVGFEAPRYDPVRTGGRQEGEVRAAVRLDSEGRVSDVRCHGGTERLRAEVARVARAWRYAPTRESPRDAFVTFRFRIDETLGMGSKPVTARMSRNSYEVVGSLPRDSWIEDPFVSRRKPSTR